MGRSSTRSGIAGTSRSAYETSRPRCSQQPRRRCLGAAAPGPRWGSFSPHRSRCAPVPGPADHAMLGQLSLVENPLSGVKPPRPDRDVPRRPTGLMAKQKHPALAENGPLGGDLTLTVSDQDSEGRWPSPVVWTTGPHQRHVYILSRVSFTPVEMPTYRFERTLDSGEQDPPEGWIHPPHGPPRTGDQ
jgi:hypothetical protein